MNHFGRYTAGMVAHRPHPRTRGACSRERERAFTILEVVVVMVIVSLVVVGLLYASRSGQSASKRLTAIATARMVGDAIEGFRKDHGGRPPRLGNARDWPSPTARGPRNPYTGKYYLRNGTPDLLDVGAAALSTSATSSARFTLHYTQSTTPNGWRIVVRDRERPRTTCEITGGAVTSSGLPVC